MKTIILISFTLVTLKVFAQQDPLYSQYMLNPLVINPSYAGLNNKFNAMVAYRTQWTGLEGQPRTLNASAHTSLLENKIGVGLVFVKDEIGNISNSETNVSVSYKLQSEQTVFSFGMQAGIQSFRTDNSMIKVFDQNDHAFAASERGSRLNIGAGVTLKSEKFLVGLSIPRLLPSTFTNGGQNFELYNRHFYLMAAYVHYLNEHLRLKPSVLLKGLKGAPPSADIAMNININAIHTAGLFSRNFNTYGILLQTILHEKFRFGYSMELPTNKSVGTQFNTHEVGIGIMLSVFSFHEQSLSNF